MRTHYTHTHRHTLIILRDQPHFQSVPSASGAQPPGGSARRPAEAPLPFPGRTPRSPGTRVGRRGETPAAGGELCSSRARCRWVARPGGWGLPSAASQSTQRNVNGATAGGALEKGLHRNRSFLHAFWFLNFSITHMKNDQMKKLWKLHLPANWGSPKAMCDLCFLFL